LKWKNNYVKISENLYLQKTLNMLFRKDFTNQKVCAECCFRGRQFECPTDSSGFLCQGGIWDSFVREKKMLFFRGEAIDETVSL